MPFEASLEEYVSVGKVVRDNNSDGDNNDGTNHENLKVELLVSLRQLLKLFDRPVHVDVMYNNDRLSDCYKQSLTIHWTKQCSIKVLWIIVWRLEI